VRTNCHAYSVPIEKSMAILRRRSRAQLRVRRVAINGNDVLAVYQSTPG
jgi:TPP-dependent pyruvate/acetoin dehydrogenase alpha subunit